MPSTSKYTSRIVVSAATPIPEAVEATIAPGKTPKPQDIRGISIIVHIVVSSAAILILAVEGP